MKPVLVTLTAPSCAGKSYLFNYIRDVAKIPCLISTTTRPPRVGEVDGVDYYFISHEESLEIEHNNNFAELMEYRGFRYGITKSEFHKKLNETDIAFLIVEPSGIDHYAKPAIDAGTLHFKVWVDVPLETRIQRLIERMKSDIAANPASVNAHINRLEAMVTVEQAWHDMAKWDLEVSGINSPQFNLDNKILKMVHAFRQNNENYSK